MKKKGVPPTVKKTGIRENEKEPLNPIHKATTDPKFWEFCPFCKLRRKIQRK